MPATEEFVPVGRIADLKIWDVWDEAMIPYILQEKGLSSLYSIKQLTENAIAKLSFKP